MKKVYLLLALFIGSTSAFSQSTVTYYIQGHQDDWQLFMSKGVVADMAAGKVVFITFTAGDAGYGKNAYGSGTVPYYVARETGSIYASKFVADFSGTPDTVPVATSATVNGHSITKYVYKNAVNYFFRLPDGNHTGVGYATTGTQSLQRLQTNAIPSIMAVDSSATYVGWTDLVNTVKAIILAEKGTDTQVWLNTPSLDATYNYDDHSDHRYSSRAAQDAVSSLLWVGITSYMDYYSNTKLANLSHPDEQSESAIFGVTVWATIEKRYGTDFEPWHKKWLQVHYYKVTRTPTGSAPPQANMGNNLIEARNALTEIPMTVSMTNPARSKEKIKLILSMYEAGKLNSAIYDMTGKLLYSQNNVVAKDGWNNVTLQNPALQTGMYIIKHTLNNKYIESKKLVVQ